jgi:hypothetical protein
LCPRCVMAEAAVDQPQPSAAHADVPLLERVADAFPQLEIVELVGRGGNLGRAGPTGLAVPSRRWRGIGAARRATPKGRSAACGDAASRGRDSASP